MAKELTWKGVYHGIFNRGSGCRYSRYCHHENNLDVEPLTDTHRVENLSISKPCSEPCHETVYLKGDSVSRQHALVAGSGPQLLSDMELFRDSQEPVGPFMSWLQAFASPLSPDRLLKG